jgi:hypothetical protein
MTWSEIFWKYVRRGEDRSAAAMMADSWEKRQEPECANCGDTKSEHSFHTAGCMTFRPNTKN